MYRLLALAMLVVASGGVVAGDHAGAPARSIAFRDVTLIDMRSERPRPGMTVVVTGDRIAAVGKAPALPANTEVVDARGKYMIPGLWDSYTFTLEAVKNGLPYFELLLAHGVTGVRDVGTSMDVQEAVRLRSEIDAGRTMAPRLFLAGPALLTQLPPRPSIRWNANSRIVTTPADGATVVNALADAGVDHIKTEKRMSPEILRAVIRAAHARGLPAVAVPPASIMQASNDGLDCIEHAAEIYRATSDKREEYHALYRDGTIDGMTTDENYAFFGSMTADPGYYAQTIKTLARNRTCVISNNSQTDTFIGDFELADSARRRFKTRAQIAQLEKKIAEREKQIREGDYRMSASNRKRHLTEIGNLHDAGVTLIAGTQTSPLAVGTPGLALHDELALFVQGGLSPFQALQTATVNPARFMRRQKDLGTIETGKLADLLLLDANPLADIANTKRIAAVVLDGRYVPRAELDSLLSRVEAGAKDH